MKSRKNQEGDEGAADEGNKDGKSEKGKDVENEMVDIWLGEWDQVPDGCTVTQGIENWQNVWETVE